jgi:hypothetical protein
VYQESVRSTTAGTGKTLLAIVAALSLLLSLFAVALPAAAQDGVGQADCPEGTIFLDNFEQEDIDVGDELVEGVFVTAVTRKNDGSGELSSVTIENTTTATVTIAVKGGADQVGNFVSIVAGDEATISVTNNPTISNLSVCQGPVSPTLTVAKATIGGDDDFQFQLDGSNAALLSNGEGDEVATTSGEFDLTEVLSQEQIDAGWKLTGVDCTGNATEEADITAGVTVTVGADEDVVCTFTNSFEEAGQQPDTGDLMIMKHLCPAGLTPAEFDQIATFGEKVFTCPVITLPGDEARADARDVSDLEDSAFPDGTGEFDFSVVAGTTTMTLADDGTFVPAPTMCPESGACVEVSHYGFGGVPQGDVTVTETHPPAGYEFGRVLFTPGSGDEATLVSAAGGVIVLDTTEDDSVMLHVYNFAPAQEQLGSITVQKEIECEVCETFTPGFFFNQGENNEGSAFAEDSLGDDPIMVAGLTFDSVQSVQDDAAPGSLLRHYLALVLNVRMGTANDCDLEAVKYSGSMADFESMTIGDILDEAEAVLNGGSSEFTEEQLHDVIDEINNADLGDDTLSCSGTTGLAGFDFVLTDEEGMEHTGTTNADGMVVFDDLPLGTYTLEETGGPDASDCTVVSASGNGVDFDAETGVITITLTSEMADVAVTVVNDCGGGGGEETERGSITILKNAVPDNGQDFVFTTTGTGLSGFSLDDDADAALSNQKVFTSLGAGTYSVTESATGGWDLTSITCSAGGTADMANRTANITLAEGANVTCTFVNMLQGQQAQTGSITILKNAVPDNAQDFAFTTIGTGLSGFSLDDDADPALSNQKTFSGLAAGMYTVAEGSVAGWTLSSLTCSPSAAVSVTGATASINLAAGANVTCTFVNTRQGSGTLPNQGPTVTPRQGTLAGNLPNTATEPFSGTSLPVALVALLMVIGLGAAAYAMKAEAARRR